MKTVGRWIALAVLVASFEAGAESAWVSDQFEVTLRSGPSTSNAIERMLPSGAEVEILERDSELGYARVRTQAGTEGWMLLRYLMPERSAREQLERLTTQLTSANERGSSMTSQLAAINREVDSAKSRIAELEGEKEDLEEQLADIQRTAADVLAINRQNRELRDQLASAEIRADTLEEHNRELASQSTRYWFMSGGLVLVVGIVLGIWLPRIRWQRRSRYDRF